MKLLDQFGLEGLSSQLSNGSKRYKIDARLESYSCKMVSEEKRQYKELVSRLNSDENQESPALYLGSSQTLRDLYEMTGQVVDPETIRMSIIQDQSPPNSSSLSPPRNVCSGRKRTRSETSICLNDSTSESPSPKFPTSALSTKDLFCLMSTLNSCFGPAYDFLTARSDEFCLEPELWLVKHYISRFCSIYVDKYEDLAPHLWKVIGDEIVPAQCRIYSYRPDHLSDPYSSGCLASFNYFFHNRCLRRVLFFSLRVLNDSLVDDDEDELTESNLY
ncbi:unnamed protein product [Schistosoma guineensis]|nr:unnamed protein product [Schistosoma guineensis]CAH8540138.1 unnamed protein product [Schistosoma bovis]CAH8541946.1 unnamed protein product [Schistosoma curassoni]CAH8543267.1 unnamed protein product [Schistosoma bovis]